VEAQRCAFKNALRAQASFFCRAVQFLRNKQLLKDCILLKLRRSLSTILFWTDEFKEIFDGHWNQHNPKKAIQLYYYARMLRYSWTNLIQLIIEHYDH